MPKYPVPPLSRCEATIERETRYWRRKFRGLLTQDDLLSEAWVVALHKVLPVFDAMRGTKIETLLTLALRQHFQRLIKVTLTRAFLYTEEQRRLLREHVTPSRPATPSQEFDRARLLARLRSLTSEQQTLAKDLADAGGRLRAVAKARRWTLRQTRERVHTLRAALLTEGGS